MQLKDVVAVTKTINALEVKRQIIKKGKMMKIRK